MYFLHNGLALLHKYTSTRASDGEFTNQHDTITCDTICIVDGYSLPHWTLSFLSTNYCLTRFTCILFLLLEYICFSIKPFVFPVSFFGQHHNINRNNTMINRTTITKNNRNEKKNNCMDISSKKQVKSRMRRFGHG